nr:MFS transporter [Bifidobacterium cuniculi]
MFAMVVCVLASANGLLGKATDAMLRSIVAQSRYAQARSVNEGRDATIVVAGSPLGGLLYGFTPWLPFMVMAACFLLSGVTVFPASRACREDGTQEKPSRQGFWQDFKEGWIWVVHQRTLLLLVAVACLMSFASSGMQYCVQMQLMSEGVSALRIGYVDTATGVVLIIGSLIATRLSKTARVGRVLVASLCCYGVSMVPMLWSQSYLVLLSCSAFAFIAFPLFNAMAMGFIFAKTPIDLQGRVSTAVGIPSQFLSMFTSAIVGFLIPSAGFSRSLLLFLCALLAALLVAVVSRRVRAIPDASHWRQYAW